jgi:hypothetical protein
MSGWYYGYLTKDVSQLCEMEQNNDGPQPGCEIGIIGLNLIGLNLPLNIACQGFPVAGGVTSNGR